MERHSLQRPYPQKRLRQLLHCHSKATLKLPNIIPKWNGEWIGIAPHVVNGSSTGHPMSWFHQHVLLNTHHGFHCSALLIWIDQGQADGRICCCQCSTRAPGASTQIRHTKIFQRWQSIDQLTYNNWSKSFRQWGQWGWLHLQDVCSYAYMYILLFYLCVCVLYIICLYAICWPKWHQHVEFQVRFRFHHVTTQPKPYQNFNVSIFHSTYFGMTIFWNWCAIQADGNGTHHGQECPRSATLFSCLFWTPWLDISRWDNFRSPKRCLQKCTKGITT